MKTVNDMDLDSNFIDDDGYADNNYACPPPLASFNEPEGFKALEAEELSFEEEDVKFKKKSANRHREEV